jgi:hypothetical protein
MDGPIKKVDTYKYILHPQGVDTNDDFSRSLASVLPGSSCKPHFTFYANTVDRLDTLLREKDGKLSYKKTMDMVSSLAKQQLFLESRGKTFFSISSKDIYVIDKTKFICVNLDTIQPLDRSMIYFKKPFLKNEFSSPEMNEIKTLPAQVFYKNWYYSLAALSFFCFTGSHISESPLHTPYNVYSSVFEGLQCIQYTKLYWVLVKCLSIHPTSRTLVFI